MKSACPIWSRDLPARLAAGAARTCGRIGNRPKRMPDKGWSRPFEDPIPLPRGRHLVTLKDAADYITRLVKAEHETAEWQAATEALIMAAEGRGPLMPARIGMLRALNRHVERVFNPDRKDWGRRKLARDQSRHLSMSTQANMSANAGHLKIFATVDAAEKWFGENDPEGLAFEYEILE